eukprot:TRINITY_DN5835_c0_g1_i4.p2 TRINITY_DN5835_c0_g1~~TRINITY_DN5835_c0_g1_i4.p2  ORF type:complete len:259 (-),score=49.32 TRINITY_DN5835_c0_g1_i4:11-787(-)
MEYNQHMCTGYNISCSFFNDERQIVTGSEDNLIYIYDVTTGVVEKTLRGHPSVVHLVDNCSSHPLKLFSSSIENTSIMVWSPETQISPETEKKNRESIRSSELRESVLNPHRKALVELTQKYGDQILKIFYKNDYKLWSPNFDWQGLLTDLGNSQSADILQMVNEMSIDITLVSELLPNQMTSSSNSDENSMGDDSTPSLLSDNPELQGLSVEQLQTTMFERQTARERQFEARELLRQRVVNSPVEDRSDSSSSSPSP